MIFYSMRYFNCILIAVLIAPVWSEGQISSTLQRNELKLPADYGDSAEVAYSLRYVTDSYSGPVIRVRRGIDSAELDFVPEHLMSDSILRWTGQNLFIDSEPDGTYTNGTRQNLIYREDTIGYGYAGNLYFPFDGVKRTYYNTPQLKPGNYTIMAVVLNHSGDSVLAYDANHNRNDITFSACGILSKWHGDSTRFKGGQTIHLGNGRYLVAIKFYLSSNCSNIGLDGRIGRRSNHTFVSGISVVEGHHNIDTSWYYKTLQTTCCNAFVKTWYNQRGSYPDATMTVLYSQPRIVHEGFLQTKNGRPALGFDGDSMYMVINGVNPYLDDLYYVGASEGTAVESLQQFLRGQNAMTYVTTMQTAADTIKELQWYLDANWRFGTKLPKMDSLHVFRATLDENNAKYYVDRTLSLDYTSGGNFARGRIFQIGTFGFRQRALKGKISEVIMYADRQTDPIAIPIQENQKKYYKTK